MIIRESLNHYNMESYLRLGQFASKELFIFVIIQENSVTAFLVEKKINT